MAPRLPTAKNWHHVTRFLRRRAMVIPSVPLEQYRQTPLPTLFVPSITHPLQRFRLPNHPLPSKDKRLCPREGTYPVPLRPGVSSSGPSTGSTSQLGHSRVTSGSGRGNGTCALATIPQVTSHSARTDRMSLCFASNEYRSGPRPSHSFLTLEFS